MKKILIVPLLLTIALAVVPVGVEAQTDVAQAELTEAQKLAQIAVQLEEIEQEVNRLTLLVTKITLEKQVVDLQRRLAAVTRQEVPVAAAPVAGQMPPAPSAFAEATADKKTASPDTAVNLPVGGQDGLVQRENDDEKGAGFAAALGPLENLGTPEIAALIILAFLAVFVLVRRLSDRKKSPLPQSSLAGPQVSEVSQMPQTPQSSSQSQPTLLQERRQDLSEKVAWK